MGHPRLVAQNMEAPQITGMAHSQGHLSLSQVVHASGIHCCRYAISAHSCYHQLIPLPAVAFFDTKWTQDVRTPLFLSSCTPINDSTALPKFLPFRTHLYRDSARRCIWCEFLCRLISTRLISARSRSCHSHHGHI